MRTKFKEVRAVVKPCTNVAIATQATDRQFKVIYCSPSKRFRFDPSRGQRTLCKYIHNFSCVSSGHDLSLQVMESCLTCGVKMDVSNLPEHRKICKEAQYESFCIVHTYLVATLHRNKTPSSDDEEFDTFPNWRSTAEKPPRENSTLVRVNNKAPKCFSLCRSVHVDLTNDEEETEGDIVQSAVAESLVQCSPEAPPYSPLTPQNEYIGYVDSHV